MDLPENQRPTHRREKIEQWLDAGIGFCGLRHPKLAEQMCDALQHFDGQRYRLLAWCIMCQRAEDWPWSSAGKPRFFRANEDVGAPSPWRKILEN